VERLVEGPVTVSRLAEPLDMTLSAVVQHLAVLEACGLVRSEKSGRTRTCHLDAAGLQLAQDWFAGQRAVWERRLDRLGDVLAADLASEPEDDTTVRGENRAGEKAKSERPNNEKGKRGHTT
jgi:DNA-binding transcriptional ArsR family regulator